MAGKEEIAKPDAHRYDADEPAEDLKSLLDSLAQEITGAGVRHAETLHDMQGRAAALSDHASAARHGIPQEYGAAIDRIEAAMSAFTAQLKGTEPQRHGTAPAADDTDAALPEAVRTEVRRAIMDAHRDTAPDDLGDESTATRMDFEAPGFDAARPPAPSLHAFGESGEELLAPSAGPEAAPAAHAAPAIEPSWLEARFADIAERVEQSLASHSPHNVLLAIGTHLQQLEHRFDRTLEAISTRPDTDPEALKAVERQMSDLFAQLDRAQSQLGRLDAIESRLADLRQNLSDEQMSRLIGSLAPSDDKISAIATAAAERVAATMRSEMPAFPAAPTTASDPRLVELTAMLDAFIGEQRQGDAHTAEALDTMQQAMQLLIDRIEAIEAAQTNHHDALMRALKASPTELQEPQVFSVRTPEPVRDMLPGASIPPGATIDSTRDVDPPPADLDAPPATHSTSAELPASPPSPQFAGGGLDRQALIAMARRAAEKVSNEAPSAPRTPATRAGPRPGLLLVASLAAFMLAGFWLVAGPSLRGLIPSFGLGTTRTGETRPTIDGPDRVTIEKQQGALSGPATTGRAVESDAAARADDGEPREQVQLASLSDRVVPEAPPALASPSEMPAASRSVEMPPAMLGPLSLRHAAAKGDPRAQFEVAARFAEGKGIPQDFAQAAIWYQRAAAQGLAPAQYRLGTLYDRGLGVPADPARARLWYSRAAEQGNLRAMHNLAVLHAGRPGVSPDYPSAVQWFMEAASRGLADSQYNLGILYESGLGVPTNNIEAYKWYALAARSGDKDATRRRDAVRRKLDGASAKAADALVIQWRAKAVEPAADDGRFAGQGWQAVRQ
ncbi:MAG: tetratricopeptide repeat protein [Hyphomicrobiaceae bacterium]